MQFSHPGRLSSAWRSSRRNYRERLVLRHADAASCPRYVGNRTYVVVYSVQSFLMSPSERVFASSCSASYPRNCQRARAPATNWLLDDLPTNILDHWQGQMEPVALPLGKVIYGAGGNQELLYFPTTAILSLLVALENGTSAEIAVAGREGLVGTSLFMGGKSASSSAVVQSAGHALKLHASVMMVAGQRPGWRADRVAEERAAHCQESQQGEQSTEEEAISAHSARELLEVVGPRCLDPVAAGGLGSVHGEVSRANQSLGTAPSASGQLGNAHADRQLQRLHAAE